MASHNITHITHYTGEVTLHYFQALTTFIQILSKIHSFTLDTLQYFIDSATKWNLLISIPKTELTRNALSRAPNIMQFGFKYNKQMTFYFKPVFMSMQVYPNKLLDAKAAKKTDIP